MNIPKTCENYAPSNHYQALIDAQLALEAEKRKAEIEREAELQARIFQAQTHQGAF